MSSGLDRVGVNERRVPEREGQGYTPAVFVRVANKRLTPYVKWKSAQGTENKWLAKAPFQGMNGLWNGGEGGTPPGILYEYQNKGVTEFAIRNRMKTKGRTVAGSISQR